MKHFERLFLALIVCLNINLFADQFDVYDVKGSANAYSATVTGKVRNNSGRNCSMFTITYKLYNKSNEVIGNASAFLSNFSPNQVWSFQARAFIKGMETYDYDTVNCL